MGTAESLSHTRWECKYHLVWIPKYRRKVLYGQLRKHLGEVLHDLAYQKESKILEGPFTGRSCTYAGINSTQVLRVAGGWVYQGQKRHSHRPQLFRQAEELPRDAFLGPGLFRLHGRADEGSIREYIKKQEKEDARLDQLQIFGDE